MIDEQKPRLEVHYPWAAVGINVTRMLADLMHLSDGTFATQKHTWWCVLSSHTYALMGEGHVDTLRTRGAQRWMPMSR